MSDLGPAVGGLIELFRPLLGPLLRVCLAALFSTAIGLGCMSIGLLAGAYHLGARGGSPTGGWLALGATLVFVALIGPVFVVKRAVGRALLHGLTTLGLGRKVLGLVFDDLLGVEAEGQAGERGSLAQRGAERIPLVDLEQRLKRVVARLTGDGGGFFSTAIRRALLDRIAVLTLEAFRAEGASGGGVDLTLVRDKLEASIDAQLVARVRGALRTTSALLACALACLSLGAAWLIGR